MLLNFNLVTLARRLSYRLSHSWTERQGRIHHRRRSRPNSGSIETLEERTLLAVFTVTNTADSGAGSLRSAITSANADAVADEIKFDTSLSGPIVLGGTQFLITNPLTITGNGANTTIIDGDAKSRVFAVTGGSAVFSGLTIRNGKTTAGDSLKGGSGGGILFTSPNSNLTILNSTISGNSVTGSSGNGGGIYVDGQGDITITGSTFSGNSTTTSGFGGGIKLFSGSAEITNSTISGNSGGGGLTSYGAHMNLFNVTVTGNSSGNSGSAGGVASVNGALGVYNSIVAGNTQSNAGSAVDLQPSGTFNTFADHSIIGNNTGVAALFPAAPIGAPDAGGNLIGTGGAPINPLIGPLADNGGPTQTHALLNGSPAINAGSNNHLTVHNITLDQRGAVRISPANSTVDIGAVEDQILPTVSLSTASQSVVEGGGTVTVTVNLSTAQASDVSVPFTLGGDAQNPTDFTATTSPVVIKAGQTSGTATITVKNDSDIEPNETITVTLGTPTGPLVQLGTTKIQTITITDDDFSPGTLAFSADKQSGDEGQTITVTVNRTNGSSGIVSVNVQIGQSSTASNTDDFTVSATTLTFADGETSKSFTVALKTDGLSEPDETVVLALASPTGGAILGAQQTHTITVKNVVGAGPVVQFDKTSQTVKDDVGTVKMTVTLSQAAAEDISVPYTVDGVSTAKNPADFVIATGALFIPKGTTSNTIDLTLKTSPGVFEPDETVSVTLGNPIGANATLGQIKTQVITIQDVDGTGPTVSFQKATQTEIEGAVHIDAPSITVVLSGAAAEDVSIPFSIDPASTAVNGQDYQITTASPLVIPKGQTTGRIFFDVKNDTADEQDETVIVKLGTPTGGNSKLGTITTHTLTIQDDDILNANPSITSSSTATVPENTTAVLKVTATDRDQGQVLTFSITGGADQNLFLITPGGDLTFKTAPDADDQTPGASLVKQVEVTVDDGNGGTAKQTITVTITPVNDNSPVFSFSDAFSIAENATAVGKVIATDADLPGTAVSYAITGGADAALFSIDAFTGKLAFKSAPDFENPGDADKNNVYLIEVTANDNDGVNTQSNRTTTQSISVTVTDESDGPVIGVRSAPVNLPPAEAKSIVAIGADATFTLPSNLGTSLAGTILTIENQGGNRSDKLAILKDAALTVKSSRINLGVSVIGQIRNVGQSLVIRLNATATANSVQEILRHITFSSTDKRNSTRQIRFQLRGVNRSETNQLGTDSNIAIRQINVGVIPPTTVGTAAAGLVINLNSDPLATNKGFLDAGASLAIETTAFGGGGGAGKLKGAVLTVSNVKVNGSPDTNGDTLTLVKNSGNTSKSLKISGGDLVNSAKTVVGSVADGRNAGKKGRDLIVTFNERATFDDVQSLLQQLVFRIKSSVSTAPRTIQVQLTNVVANPGDTPVNSNIATRKILVGK